MKHLSTTIRSMLVVKVASFVLIGMVLTLAVRAALAAPVSSSATTRAAVYEGLVTVIPGNVGDSLLEIGAAGQDLASTGDIYVRPQSLAASTSIRLTSNAGKTDVHVPGRVCLAGSCRDDWPLGGGSSTWELLGSRLLPVDRTWGVRVTGAGGGTTVPTVKIVGNNPDAALYISNTHPAGYALGSDFWSYIYGDVNATGQITVRYPGPVDVPIWHQGNDGIGSTVDADVLDGVNIEIRNDGPFGSFCFGTVECLCSNGTDTCIELFPTP